MKRSLFLLNLFSIACWLSLKAQVEEVFVSFELTFAGEPLILEKPFYSAAVGDSIQLETLRFYISAPQLVMEEQAIAAQEQYYLLDASVPNSLSITFPHVGSQPWSTLKFKLGLDSLTNMEGAKGGALDPLNGMYWSWQSGYINTKIEGISPTCPARNHRFQYHLGGYQSPHNSLQEVVLHRPALGAKIRIEIDFEVYFEQLKLQEVYQVMRPSAKAVVLSDLFASSFKLKG